MSSCFWPFTITCPSCDHAETMSDGFETDDWSELFVFSGRSHQPSAFGASPDYICPACCAKFDIDQLYIKQCIRIESIDSIKSYLQRTMSHFIHSGITGDHGWTPDMDAVLRRHCFLYPDDEELRELKTIYHYIVHARKSLTKYEPPYGTIVVTRACIPYPKFLEKVYLPDSITVIGENAFSESIIRDIFLPPRVTTIGAGAFKNCSRLETIRSSDALREIKSEAFAGTALRKFFFPNGLQKIGRRCFERTYLSEVFIPSSCEEIGDGAFFQCTRLKKVSLPRHIQSIERLFDPSVTLYDLSSPAAQMPPSLSASDCASSQRIGILRT